MTNQHTDRRNDNTHSHCADLPDPVFEVRELPPLPQTESMLMADKAAALRAWLSKAEETRIEAQERVAKAEKMIRCVAARLNMV